MKSQKWIPGPAPTRVKTAPPQHVCNICAASGIVSNAFTEIEPDRDRDGVKFTLAYACDSCILAGTADDWHSMGVTDAELDAAEARTRLAQVTA